MSHLSTLQSTWTNEPSTPTDASADIYQGIGVFKFTFDDDMPASAIGGTSTHPNATYRNAITAATLVFNDQIFNLDSDADNTIGIYVLDDAGSDASISLPLRDANEAAYVLNMKFENTNREFDNYALSNLIGLLASENAAILRSATDATSPVKYNLHQQSPLAIVNSANPLDGPTTH